MSGRIAQRYSKSLLEHASSGRAEDRVCEDMQELIRLSASSRDLRNLMGSPIISSTDKQRVFDSLFSSWCDESREFVRLAVSQRREAHLLEMAHAYLDLYDDQKGIARVKVSSAIELSEQVLEQLRRYLKSVLGKSEVYLETVTDPAIIGGMVVRYKDRLLDMSVARELRQVRKELILNN